MQPRDSLLGLDDGHCFRPARCRPPERTQLLFLEGEDPDRDISLLIDSPGGSATAGLAIFDTMQFVRPLVSTTCVGRASGIATVLLAGGAKSRRVARPWARVILNPLNARWDETRGTGTQADGLRRLTQAYYQALATASNQPVDRIEQDCERGLELSAQEARQYGIIDDVAER